MTHLQAPASALPLDPCGKGLGAFATGQTGNNAASLQWNILREDVSLPVAVLREARIEHNLQWMRRFIDAYGVKLAPHGKTTMSPALFRRQLASGAWGITLATAPQTQAAYHHGVRRVMLANQLVGRANMAIIARLQADPGFDFCCIVDSAANVDQLGRFFAEAGQTLKVLLELGVPGGRTGVRNADEEAAVLAAIARWPQALALCGVELYEGVLKDEAAIRALLRRGVTTLQGLQQQGQLADGTAILTGAGSAWFDVVAEEWRDADIGRPLDVVLRPGCYLTHDVGIYKAAETRIQTNNPVARDMHASLLPALQVWAYVQSRPEPHLAIIGLGKRDAAFDAGLPVPASYYRPGTAAPGTAPAHWQVTAMMDQHAFMQVDAADDVQIGDLIAFDISHPCLTFDKWRQLLLVDEAGNVTDVVGTYF
ncbi:D-serine dehydratase [Andreprevotia lacus DSM 23236]|uniref:D-serine dehydratase n=1 Tax=Andreprevotia lacus DSM 23236 TaxID=1121001 RepID=A0A1W1XVM5_9NEIS|nr:amino acid deaminase [Andreprevotia lacus]SMC27905.1 D-serine dehydratase [Andreprevotia lacus DSM 23236]